MEHGKHDKRFSWDDTPGESFSEAEVKKLKKENEELRNTVRSLERELARMDRVYDNSADRSSEIIANKDAEIELLRSKIVKLVAHYV